MSKNREVLKNLPGVDKLLINSEIKELINEFSEDLVKFSIRETLTLIRIKPPSEINDDIVISRVRNFITLLTQKSLRKVINATGIVVHTNLGRAPFSDTLVDETATTLKGYNNLEYDLENGERGSRHTHLTAKLKYLTGAEDVLVVNNNAAAVMLILRSFAKNREVIVSRGELIEIGGSFRIPEIMAASDCKMVEVGSTNKTHLKDYENAISESTSMLFKAHKSNYVIQGFTKEVSLKELVALGKKHKLPVFYDMGSGLLRNTTVTILEDEPDVKQTLKEGIDLVSFSGDKLIGGAQAGIIAGKSKYIALLKKEPMVRALRVGKTTLAYMETALTFYLDEKRLLSNNTIFKMLHQSMDDLSTRAKTFQAELSQHNITSEKVDHDGYCGGGALPGESIASIAVKITGDFKTGIDRSTFSEHLFYGLLHNKQPVVSILKKGEVVFDMLTIKDIEIPEIAQTVSTLINSMK